MSKYTTPISQKLLFHWPEATRLPAACALISLRPAWCVAERALYFSLSAFSLRDGMSLVPIDYIETPTADITIDLLVKLLAVSEVTQVQRGTLFGASYYLEVIYKFSLNRKLEEVKVLQSILAFCVFI